MSATESTETIIRRHVVEHVAAELQPLKKQMEDFHASTQALVSLSTQQLAQIKSVQDGHQEILLGAMPPDDDHPGLWRITTNLHKSHEAVKALVWKVLIGFAAALGAALVTFIKFGD